MLVEVVGTACSPILGVIKFFTNVSTVVVLPPSPFRNRIIFVAVGYEFLHGFSLNDVNHFASTCTIHEIAHEDTALVDEHVQDVRGFQHVLQQTGSWLCVSPSVTGMLAGIVQQVNHVVGVLLAIESESEVGVLDDYTESLRQTGFCVVVVGAPEHGVVARPVVIAIEEVHHCNIQVFADIQPLLVFCQGVALLAIEGLESVIEIDGAFLQFLFKLVYIINFLVADFNHVEIFQTTIVAVDVIFVRTLTDVQHAHVLAIDVKYGGMASLPVETLDVRCHRALDDEVAEVQVAEVVTTVAQ